MSRFRSRRDKDLATLLKDPKRGVDEVRGTGGVLAFVVRQIWAQSSFDYNHLEKAIDRYIYLVRTNTSLKSVTSYLNRSNLRRELCRPEMTWKSFMRALRIMEVKHITITFKLEFTNKYKAPVEITVPISPNSFSEGESEDELSEELPSFLTTAAQALSKKTENNSTEDTNEHQLGLTQDPVQRL